MKRGSSKPCPGCGKISSWRPANEVCDDCKKLLERAKWLEEQLSKLGSDEVVVAFGRHSHWNGTIHAHAGGNGRALLDGLHRLALSASRPALQYHAEFELLGKIDSGGTQYAVMPRPLAEAIRDLYTLLKSALRDEYEAGKGDGHNLLMRLATGDLAPNQFLAEIDE